MIIAIVASFLALFCFLRMRSFERKWRQFLQSSDGKTLESQLEDHFIERNEQKALLDSAEKRIQRLEELMKSSKRHMGVVRYDAFEDVGGSQSFALAVYDDQGDGAVITSIVGRTDCRVYCKPLVRGRSDRTLSQEETRAMEEGYQRASRPVISS